jgi:hypothetical protein
VEEKQWMVRCNETDLFGRQVWPVDQRQRMECFQGTVFVVTMEFRVFRELSEIRRVIIDCMS